LEERVARALDVAGIVYRQEKDGGTEALDFYLPELDLYIEIKGGHSSRIARQMGRAKNVIAVQGKAAVTFMEQLLRNL